MTMKRTGILLISVIVVMILIVLIRYNRRNNIEMKQNENTLRILDYLTGDNVLTRGELITGYDESTGLKTFDSGYFQHEINHSLYEGYVSPVTDTDELLRQVDSLWRCMYGERIEEEKPYQLYYDSKNKIWLVTGTFSKEYTFGGVASALIENDTGRILAVWHGK